MNVHLAFILFMMIISTKWIDVDATDHLLCKKVDEVFESENHGDESSGTSVTQRVQGRPGKRGMRGIKGEVGTRGPPGRVDYDEIDRTIENKVNREIEDSMIKYNAIVVQLQEELENLKHRQELCKVRYAGKCFWFVLHESQDVTFSQISDLCAQEGGTPANIYGRNHYEEIQAYLDTITPITTIFTGMTINNSNKAIQKRDGTNANWALSSMKWYPGHPTNNAGWTALGIHSDRDPSDPQGVHNYPKSKRRRGVICEM